jgi:hypothetical protein
MAKTRAEIITNVKLNTGFSGKDTLLDGYCDTGLKVALLKHSFRDAVAQRTWAITTGNDSVQIQGTGGSDDDANNWDVLDVVTARIIDTSGDDYHSLKLKNRLWWDKFVVSAEDNQQGWPEFGCRLGNYIYFERPVESNRSLYLRATRVLTFAGDSTECPIEVLDVFLEHYVTAQAFLNIHEHENYIFWNKLANQHLMQAIDADQDTALNFEFERGSDMSMHRHDGTAITNNTNYGGSGTKGVGSGSTWY